MSRTPGLPAVGAIVGESVVSRRYSASDVWVKPPGLVAAIITVTAAGAADGDPPAAWGYYAAADLAATEAVTFGAFTGTVDILEIY